MKRGYRVILPFPGGATDFLDRVVGQRLANAIGVMSLATLPEAPALVKRMAVNDY